jgi:hypothetical protein
MEREEDNKEEITLSSSLTSSPPSIIPIPLLRKKRRLFLGLWPNDERSVERSDVEGSDEERSYASSRAKRLFCIAAY